MSRPLHQPMDILSYQPISKIKCKCVDGLFLVTFMVDTFTVNFIDG